LSLRPTAEDLRQQHILPDAHTAPGLAAAALSLTRRLPQRPTREDLTDQNILKRADPGVSARLDELNRQHVAGHLDRHLTLRPGPLDLIHT
jgi:hypothetical protein